MEPARSQGIPKTAFTMVPAKKVDPKLVLTCVLPELSSPQYLWTLNIVDYHKKLYIPWKLNREEERPDPTIKKPCFLPAYHWTAIKIDEAQQLV